MQKKIFDTFVLTKEIISSQKKNNEPIVWIMKTNQYRHELMLIKKKLMS